MNEKQAQLWMNGLAAEGEAGLLPDPERIWIRAQLDARFEPRRRAGTTLLWLDAAVQSAAGIAVAALSVWLIFGAAV